SILEAVEDPLHAQGLILVQRLVDDGGLALVTELIHAESGESINSYASVVCAEPNNPQKVGSAITYYRRYSLLTLLNLTPEEDDDGNAASKPGQAFATYNTGASQPASLPRPTSSPQANGSAPARAPQPPTPQRPPQPPTPALAPDDPLAAAVAKLRAMETEGKPWDAIKKYAEEQWELADDYGKEIINSTAKAIKVRRKVAAPVAPAHEVS
nr:ERF family protein [Gemmatimonadales bacterium]